MPLDQKRILITGAGSGIGRALAVEAARRGMIVAICGRRLEALQQTAGLLAGSAPLVMQADVTLAHDRRQLFERVRDAWGSLDILVNNAGIVEGAPLQDMDDAALERTFQTNVIAPMALARDFMPLLAAARPSRVVNIGSIFGDIPYPLFAAYSASKFALRGFSSALRREWVHQGIGVTYAAPRATQTDAAAAFDQLVSTAKMTLDPPEKVARQIFNAIARGENSVYATGPERLFVLIQRLVPGLIDRALKQHAPSPSAQHG